MNTFANRVSKQANKIIYIDEDVNASNISLYVPSFINDKDIFSLFNKTIEKKGYRLKRLGLSYYLEKKRDPKKQTYLFNLKYDTSKDITPLLASMGVKHKYLQDSNSYIVTCTQKQYNKLHSYISILDRKVPQVKVKIMIFEYQDSSVRDIGVQIGTVYKDISTATQTALNAIVSSVATHGISLSSTSFYSAIKLLQKESVIDVKQYPYVIAKNNHIFKFEAVRNVPYLVTTTETDSNTVKEQQSVEYKDVGLQIGGRLLDHGSYATLNLNLIVQDFVNEEITNTPQTYKRTLTNNTDIEYNKVLLISGLKRLRQYKNDYSIPYLSNIPFLGKIFQYKTKNAEEVNISIAIELVKDVEATATLSTNERSE